MKQVISRHALQNMLGAIKGATFVSLKVATEPAMRKTGNPFVGQVIKMTEMNVTINFIYANSVNNQRTKEGNEPDFVPHFRKWGTRIEKTPLVEHKGTFYLECKPNGKPKSVQYFNLSNGELMDKSILEPFLQEKTSMKEHQGVEKEIIVRDIKLENIREITLNGKTYEVVR